MENKTLKIAVMGASGYAGHVLVKQLMSHSTCDVVLLTAHQGAGTHLKTVNPIYEALGEVGLLKAHDAVLEMLVSLDVIFLALPHGVSQKWVKGIREAEVKNGLSKGLVIDLSGDYRLTQEDYKKWYGETHADDEGLKEMVYGLPSLFHVGLGEKGISNPGCYPTASLLALAPLVAAGLISSDDLVVDAKSGVSGAGRNLNMGNLYCEVNESVKPYSVGQHRHTPEIEYHLEKLAGRKCVVQFTPHLVPMQYGLLASVYGRFQGTSEEMPTDEVLMQHFLDYYAKSPVVKVIAGMPETRWAVGTPYAYIGVKGDSRTRRIMAFCAIDNTRMGAATQAIHNMNLAKGLDPLMGLI